MCFLLFIAILEFSIVGIVWPASIGLPDKEDLALVGKHYGMIGLLTIKYDRSKQTLCNLSVYKYR